MIIVIIITVDVIIIKLTTLTRDQYGIPLKILSYEDLYGWTMDKIVAQVEILLPAPFTMNPAPCTLHPAPCTLHPAPGIFIFYLDFIAAATMGA